MINGSWSWGISTLRGLLRSDRSTVGELEKTRLRRVVEVVALGVRHSDTGDNDVSACVLIPAGP